VEKKNAKSFKERWGCSEENFKKKAKELPKRCFREAYNNSLQLGGNRYSPDEEKWRFELLKQVAKERGIKGLKKDIADCEYIMNRIIKLEKSMDRNMRTINSNFRGCASTYNT